MDVCSDMQLDRWSQLEVQHMLVCLSDAALLDIEWKCFRGQDPQVGLRVMSNDIERAFGDHVLLKHLVKQS